MKRTITIICVLVLFFASNVSAKTYYTNKKGVNMSKEEYDRIVENYSINRAESITQEKFNQIIKGKIIDKKTVYQKVTYNENGIISEENISKKEYDNSEYIDKKVCTIDNKTRANDNGFIETSYKKFEVSLTDLQNLYDIYAGLTWKKVPACRSYDVFAFRTAHFSYSSVIGTQRYYVGSSFTSILYDSTSQGYKSASNGAGFSMNLKDGNNITKYFMDLNADLQISEYNYSTARVWVTYQHAQNDLTRTQSMSYTINHMGLGDVVYYTNNYIANTYDDMAGIELTTPIP